MKKIITTIFIAIAFAAGFLIAKQFFSPTTTTSKEVSSKVLLNKIDKVSKLITIEGNFTEHLDETNKKEVTLYLPFPTYWNFNKQAIIEVSGNVMVGYNLQEMSIAVDSTHKIITLSNLPSPQIMAIDHDIKYKFLEESFFNSFTPDDYTALNKNAKAILRQAAIDAHLLEKAQEQGNQIIDAIQFITQAAGWKLEIIDTNSPSSPPLGQKSSSPQLQHITT